MRIAIIGAGSIGEVHARLLDSLPEKASLVAVVDSDLDRAGALANPRGARAYQNPAQLYTGEDVDAVAICVPSGLHADIAVEALAAGKHVLVEKPIDITLAGADRIIKAEQLSNKVVSVISQRRFQPSSAFVRRAIVDGRLGNLTSGITESMFYRPQAYYDSGAWRGTLAVDGGGALMNQGIHALDLLIWMMGEPERVSAHTGRLGHQNIEVEDIAAATIIFAGGAIGTVVASTAAYPGRSVRLSIHGLAGSAVIDDDHLAYFHTRQDEDGTDAPANQPIDLTPPTPGFNAVDSAHRDQYEDFIEAISVGRRPLVTSHDGRRSLALVLAIYESAASGEWVTLTPETGQ